MVERALGQFASGLLVLENLVETDGIVQCETETDGVSGLEDLQKRKEQRRKARRETKRRETSVLYPTTSLARMIVDSYLLFLFYADLGGDLLSLLVVVSCLLLVLLVSDELSQITVIISSHLHCNTHKQQQTKTKNSSHD